MKLGALFAELKRRNLYKVAIAYAVIGWLLVQIATQVFPFFAIPNSVVRMIVGLIIVGFPIAVVSAWAFELPREGIDRAARADRSSALTRRRGRKLTALIVVVATLAAAVTIFRFLPATKPAGQNSARWIEGVERKSIAVLPFENLSTGNSNAYFTDGVQDEILTRKSSRALRLNMT